MFLIGLPALIISSGHREWKKQTTLTQVLKDAWNKRRTKDHHKPMIRKTILKAENLQKQLDELDQIFDSTGLHQSGLNKSFFLGRNTTRNQSRVPRGIMKSLRSCDNNMRDMALTASRYGFQIKKIWQTKQSPTSAQLSGTPKRKCCNNSRPSLMSKRLSQQHQHLGFMADQSAAHRNVWMMQAMV